MLSESKARLLEQVGQAAAAVPVPEFVPKQGVQIETDPKASSVSKATAMGDDEGAINALIERLEVRSDACWSHAMLTHSSKSDGASRGLRTQILNVLLVLLWNPKLYLLQEASGWFMREGCAVPCNGIILQQLASSPAFVLMSAYLYRRCQSGCRPTSG